MSTWNFDLSKVPLAPNPTGAPPNFVDPPSLETAFLGEGIALIVTSTIILAIRLFANYKHAGKLWFDDYLCIIAWTTSIAYWSVFRTLVASGTARHAWDTPISIITLSFVKRLLAQQVLSNTSMWASKACILALFARVFNSIRWIRHTANILIVFSGLFYLSAIAVWTAYCTPRAGERWEMAIIRASTREVTGFVVAVGVVGLAIDCIMFAMPFPVIYKLQMQSSKKIGFVVVFSIALCTVVAGTASLAYRIVAIKGAGGDPTWVGMNICLTSMAEQFGTVIVSCAPGLASFWYHIFTKSRIYSHLQSKILHRSTTAANKDYGQSTGPRRCTSEEYLADGKVRKGDVYRLADLVMRTGESDDRHRSEENFAAPTDFITSAISHSTRGKRLSSVE